MSRLDEAFAAAERVHNSKTHTENPQHRFNYLRLECMGKYNHDGDRALWAASFDTVLPEEWYERVDEQCTSARGRTAEDAILAAARRFQETTNEVIFQD